MINDDESAGIMEGCTEVAQEKCTQGIDVILLLGGDGTLMYLNSLLQDCMFDFTFMIYCFTIYSHCLILF
jgi:NAD kinase